MRDAGDFIEEFAEYAELEHSDTLHSYAGYTGGAGALLLKIRHSSARILFKPWLRTAPVGLRDLTRSRERYRTFKKQFPAVQVHVARSFRANATRLPNEAGDLMLISYQPDDHAATLVGSPNLPSEILEALLGFAEERGLAATYDFIGTLRHRGYSAGLAQADAVRPKEANPRLFLSYSWDSDEHRHWVLGLAAKLIRNGIRVVIDEWNLGEHGDDLHRFIESGIREADYVVLVCTPVYARRANQREGGVGVESTVITGEFYDPQKAGKFIPIVRRADGDLQTSLPTFLRSHYAYDFRQDDQFERHFEELLRKVLELPRFRRPELGSIPRLTSEEI